MSEDGFSDSFEEPNIEVQIKTLMGTTFDIKVSSNETVADIKKKIYRVEGIPVYQQNLIYNYEELKDTARLGDIGIKNGSTVTLVSSMRGGPISTRRLSVSCEHYLLKELKDLLENTRDEVTPGSKVSVLVFKEGDIINLLRVIENEDGSYSPYSDSPISPPLKPNRKDVNIFERFVEDTEMCTKVMSLRKKMEELNLKRQNRSKQDSLEREESASCKAGFSYRFLEECTGEMDNSDLKILEKHLDEENQSENEEIALKDKHRTKPKLLQSLPLPRSSSKSLYSERKSSYSHTRHNYAKMAKKRESRLFGKENAAEGYSLYARDRQTDLLDSANFGLNEPEQESSYLLNGLNSNKLPDLKILDTDDFETLGGEEVVELPVSNSGPIGDRNVWCSRNSRSSRILPNINSRRHQQEPTFLPQPTFSDTPLAPLETLGNLSSRGESPILGAAGGTSVEEMGAKLAEQLHLLEDDPNGDLYGESLSVSTANRVQWTSWVLAAEGAERPKNSPDSIELEEHSQNVWEIHESASERLKHSATCKVGLLKRRQNYNYESLDNAQKPGLLGNSKSSREFGVCSGANFYLPQCLTSPSAIPPQYAPRHHPKYGEVFIRNEPRSPLYSRKNRKEELESKEDKQEPNPINYEVECSSIQRLKNDNLFGPKEDSNADLFGYYNLGCATDLLEKQEQVKEIIKLPPVIKKKSRCSECNRRLNITNIYNCRCGRIFCSQHRYSEAHRCNYDYKTEGRKILERQNPLVTADKLQRF